MDGNLEKPIKKMLDITPGKGAKAKALSKKVNGETLNAWGQDAKTAKMVRSHLRKEKKMKSFMRGASARHDAGY